MATLTRSAGAVRKAGGGGLRSASRRLCIAVAICAAGAGAAAPVRAQGSEDEAATLERRVKAAFVYKFVGFVDWPPGAFPQADTPIVIGVMGEEAIARDIAEASMNRTVEGRRIEVRRFSPGESLEGVHILFMRQAAFERLGDSIGALQPQAMLIVTESADALDYGSVINFLLDGGKVRFDISLEAAERRGLKLSSRLITVAREVIGKPR
jgi:hypothetical protein